MLKYFMMPFVFTLIAGMVHKLEVGCPGINTPNSVELKKYTGSNDGPYLKRK
jgi:hypothetical protein